MKMNWKGGSLFELHLDETEWLAFLKLLSQYPCRSAENHSLTRRDTPDPDLEESNQLLRDSVVAHQGERAGQLNHWLASLKQRFSGTCNEFRLEFDPERADWLVEILNDIRIGNWLDLGYPTPDEVASKDWKPEDWVKLSSMEISGMFQAILLKGLG